MAVPHRSLIFSGLLGWAFQGYHNLRLFRGYNNIFLRFSSGRPEPRSLAKHILCKLGVKNLSVRALSASLSMIGMFLNSSAIIPAEPRINRHFHLRECKVEAASVGYIFIFASWYPGILACKVSVFTECGGAARLI